jgi:hypothetical protein
VNAFYPGGYQVGLSRCNDGEKTLVSRHLDTNITCGYLKGCENVIIYNAHVQTPAS